MRVPVAAVAALLAGAAAAPAQSSSAPPVVDIASKGSTITVSGVLQSGTVTFRFTHDRAKEADPEVFRLKDGVTREQFERGLAALKSDPTPLLKYGTFVSGAILAPGAAAARMTTVLTPGDYVALNTAGRRPLGYPRVAFSVTAGPSPAPRPAPTSSYGLTDFRFRGPSRIAPSGVMRIVNRSKSLHFVVALKAPKGYSATRLAALLKAGRESSAPKTTRVRGLLGLVGPGASNDVAYSLPRGHWVLACFMQTSTSKGRAHTTLGMEKVVSVS